MMLMLLMMVMMIIIAAATDTIQARECRVQVTMLYSSAAAASTATQI